MDEARRKYPLEKAHQMAKALGTATAEALWPTRCALCDQPGAFLCAECREKLPYLDHNLACPRCGAPWGLHQCTECNSLSSPGAKPYDSCESALVLTDDAKRIVTTFKDRGDQLMADTLAEFMAALANPSWIGSIDAVTYVPATTAAVRRRGFDHGRLIALALGNRLGLPVLGLLGRPQTLDQRRLTREKRQENMADAFRLNPKAVGKVPPNLLLTDDVTTTGATLESACWLLKSKGAQHIHCVTFAHA